MEGPVGPKGPKGDKGDKGDPGAGADTLQIYTQPNQPVEGSFAWYWFETDGATGTVIPDTGGDVTLHPIFVFDD